LLNDGFDTPRKSMRGYSTIGFDYIPTKWTFLLALAEGEDNQ